MRVKPRTNPLYHKGVNRGGGGKYKEVTVSKSDKEEGAICIIAPFKSKPSYYLFYISTNKLFVIY